MSPTTNILTDERKRKLATIKLISEVQSIEKADAIEKVDGR
jgi:hypothetical protein